MLNNSGEIKFRICKGDSYKGALAFWEKQSKNLFSKGYLGCLKIWCYKNLNWAQQFLRIWCKSKGFWTAYGFFFFLETVGSHRFEKEFHTDMIITPPISCYLYKTEVGESVLCGTRFLSHGDFRGWCGKDKLKTWDIILVKGLTVKSHQQKHHQVTLM